MLKPAGKRRRVLCFATVLKTKDSLLSWAPRKGGNAVVTAMALHSWTAEHVSSSVQWHAVDCRSDKAFACARSLFVLDASKKEVLL